MLCSLLTTICNPHCLAAVLLASHHECAKETWLECKNNKTITHTQDLAAYELEVFPLNIHCASQHCLFCSRCWIRHSYPLCQHFRNAFIFSFAHAECLVKFAFALKTRLEQTLSLAVKMPKPHMKWLGWIPGSGSRLQLSTNADSGRRWGWVKSWVPATNMGNLGYIPSSQFQP